MTVSSIEWVLPWKLTDLEFYMRALTLNPHGNNMHKGASGRVRSNAFAESHGLTSAFRASISPPVRHEGVCSILNGPHEGAPVERYYMMRGGEIVAQTLCENHGRGNWLPSRPTFDEVSAKRKRNTSGEGFGDYSY